MGGRRNLVVIGSDDEDFHFMRYFLISCTNKKFKQKIQKAIKLFAKNNKHNLFFYEFFHY